MIRAKSEGAAPGFTIRDSAGVMWFIAFDPKSNPEGATGAAVVASKIFWTLGYYQAEYYIAELRPEQLTVDPNATFTPVSGKERRMTLKDIQPVLKRGAAKRTALTGSSPAAYSLARFWVDLNTMGLVLTTQTTSFHMNIGANCEP